MKRYPNRAQAEAMLDEAGRLNPGPWLGHSRAAAKCASLLAEKCALDQDRAYVLGLLHDIGRRRGVTSLRHVLDGYQYLADMGYPDAARACLTHSFPTRTSEEYQGRNDLSEGENSRLRGLLKEIRYDDYDRLIQLCDALAAPGGVVYLEKRLVDVALRCGVNENTIPKWKAYFELYEYFSARVGGDLYELLSARLNG